jgi:hypothetical protein
MISEFIIFNREREIERKDREEREAAWEKELLQVCHSYYLCFFLSSSAQCATQYPLLSLVRERGLPAAPVAALLHLLTEFAFVLHRESATYIQNRARQLPARAHSFT